MSSIQSGSTTSSSVSSTKPLAGFAGNLTPLQEYRLKEFHLVCQIAVGKAPPTSKVGVPMPKETSDDYQAPKASRFSFRSAAPTGPETYNYATCASQFKKATGNMSSEQIETAFRSAVRGDYWDIQALRFLRARKWDLPNALEQFGATLHWRTKDWNIDTMLERGEEYYISKEPDEGFINQYKQGKVTLHGHDKQGRPLVFIHVSKHDPKAQSELAMERYTLHVIEAARMCLNREVNTAAVVFDLSNFGLHNMDYSVVKFILTCFEKFYPECLGYLFIHRAPWVFSSVWAIIKGWIDPVVASKISFTKNEKDLLKFIDSDQIPKSLGGTSRFEYEWIAPKEGESSFLDKTEERNQLLKQRDELSEKLEKETFAWATASDKAAIASADDAREKTQAQLIHHYYKLDPYTRARTIADRNGSLGEFKPELRSGGLAQPTL